MAQLRIDQLPSSSEELREQKTARAIPLPALGDRFDGPPGLPPLDRDKAVESAHSCVEKLKENPNNVQAREKLARLLAEHLDQAGQGIDQITLLLNMPDRSESERAEWLGIIAAWHIRYRQDVDTGRKFLERVVQEFPGSPQAFAARRRLAAFDRELKSKPQ
jgi:hypothetical protein